MAFKGEVAIQVRADALRRSRLQHLLARRGDGQSALSALASK